MGAAGYVSFFERLRPQHKIQDSYYAKLISLLPAFSPRVLWLRSRCCSVVLLISARLRLSADWSVKWFPDRCRLTRVLFLLSMPDTALAPKSPRWLSDRSTSGIKHTLNVSVQEHIRWYKRDNPNNKTWYEKLLQFYLCHVFMFDSSHIFL